MACCSENSARRFCVQLCNRSREAAKDELRIASSLLYHNYLRGSRSELGWMRMRRVRRQPRARRSGGVVASRTFASARDQQRDELLKLHTGCRAAAAPPRACLFNHSRARRRRLACDCVGFTTPCTHHKPPAGLPNSNQAVGEIGRGCQS